MKTDYRFWSKVELAKLPSTEECWKWTAAVSGCGYGNYYLGKINGQKKYGRPHVVVYELLYGKVEKGLQIDHLCRQKLCVNPWHLEVVTPLENSRRKFGVQNSDPDRCMYGHSRRSTYWTKAGKRECRRCQALYSKRYRDK